MTHTRFTCSKCGYHLNKEGYCLDDITCPLGHGSMLKKAWSEQDYYLRLFLSLSIVFLILAVINMILIII